MRQLFFYTIPAVLGSHIHPHGSQDSKFRVLSSDDDSSEIGLGELLGASSSLIPHYVQESIPEIGLDEFFLPHKYHAHNAVEEDEVSEMGLDELIGWGLHDLDTLVKMQDSARELGLHHVVRGLEREIRAATESLLRSSGSFDSLFQDLSLRSSQNSGIIPKNHGFDHLVEDLMDPFDHLAEPFSPMHPHVGGYDDFARGAETEQFRQELVNGMQWMDESFLNEHFGSDLSAAVDLQDAEHIVKEQHIKHQQMEKQVAAEEIDQYVDAMSLLEKQHEEHQQIEHQEATEETEEFVDQLSHVEKKHEEKQQAVNQVAVEEIDEYVDAMSRLEQLADPITVEEDMLI